MKIVLVSLDQAWENKNENQLKICKELQLIGAYHPDLIVFPEMTLTGFTMNSLEFAECKEKSPTVHFFSEYAKKMNCYIVFGVILQTDGKLPTNNLIVVNAEGELVAQYAKIHPFSYSGENEYYSKGEKLSSFQYNGHKIGLSICYDLRFPELFQALSKDCDAIIVIANWPKKRSAHWTALLLARAIETQSYMIGVNRTGIDGNNLEYEESSLVISPNGENVKILFLTEYSNMYDIDLLVANDIRRLFPVKRDRQIEMYKDIL